MRTGLTIVQDGDWLIPTRVDEIARVKAAIDGVLNESGMPLRLRSATDKVFARLMVTERVVDRRVVRAVLRPWLARERRRCTPTASLPGRRAPNLRLVRGERGA